MNPNDKKFLLLNKFFSQWELLWEDDWSVAEWEKHEIEELPCRIEDDQTVQEVDFFSAYGVAIREAFGEITQDGYWKTRCEAAEAYIESIPHVPRVFGHGNQELLFKWQKLKKEA